MKAAISCGRDFHGEPLALASIIGNRGIGTAILGAPAERMVNPSLLKPPAFLTSTAAQFRLHDRPVQRREPVSETKCSPPCQRGLHPVERKSEDHVERNHLRAQSQKIIDNARRVAARKRSRLPGPRPARDHSVSRRLKILCHPRRPCYRTVRARSASPTRMHHVPISMQCVSPE